MDLQEDIRQHVLANLPHDPGDRSELAAKSACELLVFYKNWLDRLVAPRPRDVHISPALLSNPLAADPRYKPGLDQIVASLKVGTEITPHLSRAISHGYQAKDTTERKCIRQDLDLLLNDWGILHLHLCTEIEADGFVKRSGPLLFAVFRPKDAYLIDILGHGAWTREHLIEVIVAEWPNAELVHELKGALGLNNRLTEQDRKVLRKKHANALFEFDGKVYMPAGGMMASGVSIRSVMAADQVLHCAKWFETELQNNPKFISETFTEMGLTPPSDPDLHFEFFEDSGYGVVERRTGMRIRLAH